MCKMIYVQFFLFEIVSLLIDLIPLSILRFKSGVLAAQDASDKP